MILNRTLVCRFLKGVSQHFYLNKTNASHHRSLTDICYLHYACISFFVHIFVHHVQRFCYYFLSSLRNSNGSVFGALKKV